MAAPARAARFEFSENSGPNACFLLYKFENQSDAEEFAPMLAVIKRRFEPIEDRSFTHKLDLSAYTEDDTGGNIPDLDWVRKEIEQIHIRFHGGERLPSILLIPEGTPMPLSI